MKKSELYQTITQLLVEAEDNGAAAQAKRRGLVSIGFGRWKDPRSNKWVATSVNDRLVPHDLKHQVPVTAADEKTDDETQGATFKGERGTRQWAAQRHAENKDPLMQFHEEMKQSFSKRVGNRLTDELSSDEEEYGHHMSSHARDNRDSNISDVVGYAEDAVSDLGSTVWRAAQILARRDGINIHNEKEFKDYCEENILTDSAVDDYIDNVGRPTSGKALQRAGEKLRKEVANQLRYVANSHEATAENAADDDIQQHIQQNTNAAVDPDVKNRLEKTISHMATHHPGSLRKHHRLMNHPDTQKHEDALDDMHNVWGQSDNYRQLAKHFSGIIDKHHQRLKAKNKSGNYGGPKGLPPGSAVTLRHDELENGNPVHGIVHRVGDADDNSYHIKTKDGRAVRAHPNYVEKYEY